MRHVALIGFGVMGRAMAARLKESGVLVGVYVRSEPERARAEEFGYRTLHSLGTLPTFSKTVLVSLPNASAVDQVLSGPDGILPSLRPGSVILDTSTIGPADAQSLARRVADHDAQYLDAPVSGGEDGARSGTLSIMVGGDPGAFRKVRWLLGIMGATVTLVGDSGAGQTAKACNQLVVAVTIGAVAEALVLAAKAGVDPWLVRKALLGGFASSRVLELHGLRMLTHSFKAGAAIRLHAKDVAIYRELSQQLQCPIPLGAQAGSIMAHMAEKGMGELDHAALVSLVEEAATTTLEQWHKNG